MIVEPQTFHETPKEREVLMPINPVGWFEIYVDDIDRAKGFYETVLQHPLQALPLPDEASDEVQMLAFPMHAEATGASGALVKANRISAGGNSVMIYFSCEDCGPAAGRVVSAGGELMRDKMAIGEHGFCAIAVDTEGNTFGLHSQI